MFWNILHQSTKGQGHSITSNLNARNKVFYINHTVPIDQYSRSGRAYAHKDTPISWMYDSATEDIFAVLNSYDDPILNKCIHTLIRNIVQLYKVGK
jgi:hypothetical protein